MDASPAIDHQSESDQSKEILDRLCVNTIRTLSIDAIQKANSGHPGMPMGAATMAYVLWTRHLRHNPKNPEWPDRDRFELSAGHASMLLYSMLFLTGYDLAIKDIEHFRQWESRTPGHPENGRTPGVEVTTGPLGQGFANAVGLAIAERWLAATFNRHGDDVVDHYTYVLASDGDMMEGVAAEAASLAGRFRLGRLIVLYDSNLITLSATTNITFSEDVGARFEAYGWHVQRIDGQDTAAVDAALTTARAVEDRPSLIVARTHIGYGSPHKQDTWHAHGEPLGAEEMRLTKRALGWPEDRTFYVPDEALDEFRKSIARGAELEAVWQHRMDDYNAAHIGTAEEFARTLAGDLPPGWEAKLPTFTSADGEMATRDAGGKVINENMMVIRPSDATETVEAWRVALQHTEGPVGLVLTRQKLPVLDRRTLAPASGLAKGAYVLAETHGSAVDVILIATGSEVSLALEAHQLLAKEGIRSRVVSMPCWELFDAQPQSYRDAVLPPCVHARVSIEAAASFGWERYVGPAGAIIGVNRFGVSAPGPEVMRKFGFTPKHIVETAKALLGKKRSE